MEMMVLGLKTRPQLLTPHHMDSPVALRIEVPYPTNCGSKILRKKIPESSQKQNLNLLCAGNYLHSVYIVVTTNYIAFALC